MRGEFGVSAMGGLLMLAWCADKQAANPENFGAAIERFLAGNADLCLGLTRWPIETEPSREGLYGPGESLGPQLCALEGAGVIVGTAQPIETADSVGGQGGVMRQVLRYDLTEKGRNSYRAPATRFVPGGADVSSKDLCFGRLVLDKVVAWEEFAEGGEPKQVRVDYSYKVDGLADWAKDEGVRGAFRSLALAVDGIGTEKRSIVVKLTSEGWAVAGSN